MTRLPITPRVMRSARRLMWIVLMSVWLLTPASGCATTSRVRFDADSHPSSGVATRIVSYNIRHGRGMDDRVDLDRTAATLAALNPDIVGLQEVDMNVRRSGSVNQAAELGRRLGLHEAFGPFMDLQGGRYGMAILSRYPLRSVREIKLPTGNEPRIALAAEVRLPTGESMMIINVHFDWVGDDGFRFAQAEALAEHLRSLAMPFVLLGDFNDQSGSRTLALFEALAMEAKKPADNRMTFSSTKPASEIDFIFLSPATRWKVRSVSVIDEPMASDHRPVVAEAVLTANE